MSGDVRVEIQNNEAVFGTMKDEVCLVVLGVAGDPAKHATSACESTPDAMYFARQGLHNLSNSSHLDLFEA